MSTKNCGGGFTHSTQVGFDKNQACSDVAEVSSCLGKEIFDLTVDVWDDPGCDGDNVVRVFNKDECVYSEGYFYWSKEDMNVDMPPSAKWSEGFTKCEMLKPYSLVSCSGELLLSGDSVASCKDLSDAIDAIPDAPSLTKCGGGDVDGPLVQCDQLSTSDFMINPATGMVMVNTQELCIVTEASTDPCASYQQLYVVTGADGCSHLITSDNLDLVIARLRSNRADDTGLAREELPQMPTDATTHYTLDDLRDDVAAGTLDETKLLSTRVMSHTLDIPCEATYLMSLEALVSFDPDLAGRSTYVLRLDGEFLPTSTGGTVPRSMFGFSSFDANNFDELAWLFTAGSHTLELFVVSATTTGAAAQVPVIDNGSPVLEITRRIT